MDITEIRVRIMDRQDYGPLKAYCSVTFDNLLVVHDIKVLQMNQRLFMVMPSRPSGEKCPYCNGKNLSLARVRYCCECGQELPELVDGPSFFDVVHPISQKARSWIEDCVLAAYWDEKRKIANGQVCTAGA